MIGTNACKMRGLVKQDECRLCSQDRETVQHVLARCKTFAGAEHKRHVNALKVLAGKWAINNGLLPEGTKWFIENWGKGMMIESNGKKLYQDFEHSMISCSRTWEHVLEQVAEGEDQTWCLKIRSRQYVYTAGSLYSRLIHQ